MRRLLILVCLLATPVVCAAGLSPAACRKSCRTLEHSCRLFSRAAVAKACAGQGASCRHSARPGLKRDLTGCRAFTREQCRPCCPAGGLNECARAKAVGLEAEAQVGGDAVNGRDLLLNGDFMTCGVPTKLWDFAPARDVITRGFGGGENPPTIADRRGKNAELPFFLNDFVADNGAHVINGNCLMCHGGRFNGELVIGLGNHEADFTGGAGAGAGGIALTDELLDLLGLDMAEKDQLRRIGARGGVLGPRTMMRTVGMNPAELFAIILMVHHDRDTLEWSDGEVTPFNVRDASGAPIAEPLLTSDPPPWWRAHKKNALFYNGMARGDQRGTMALATSVCIDSVARAQQVDAMFRDIQAYVDSIRAPQYPFPIDGKLADRGREVFAANCSSCHGTYGERDEDETYPNLLVPLDVIGTDPVVANAGVVHSPELVTWYNQSFYGQITRMAPNDPFPGYMPPPLDGIWATAPYLHNGSVPTLELVLNSRARPTRWKRLDLDSTHFDQDALGWPFAEVDTPQAEAPADERKFIYDTTYWSQANGGHTFGDHLTPAERRAVIEYLKTL